MVIMSKDNKTTLSLLSYNTGWGYGIYDSEIEAHAPSVISLRARDDCELAVVPSIRSGGRYAASPGVCVEGISYQLEYSSKFYFDLKAGDVITLRFTVTDNDKHMCWSYWIIDNVNIELPTLTLHKHTHLGDSLSFLVALNSAGEKNGITYRVKQLPIYREILSCFNLSNVRCAEEESMDTLNLDTLFSSASWDEFWLDRFYTSFTKCFTLLKTSEVNIPVCYIKNEKTVDKYAGRVAVQFDSRSASRLSMEDALGAIRLLACKGCKPVAVGGPDSAKYLGDSVEYSYGDLAHIITELHSIGSFIGVESGVSHIAGVLGIPSILINLIEQRTVINLYRKYKNMTFVSKDSILKILRHSNE